MSNVEILIMCNLISYAYMSTSIKTSTFWWKENSLIAHVLHGMGKLWIVLFYLIAILSQTVLN